MLFSAEEVIGNGLLVGAFREEAVSKIERFHYTRSFPSGKTHVFLFDTAIVCFSIPANMNISQYLIGVDNAVWELSRLWAPDGHAPNLLTWAISQAITPLRKIESQVAALVSYADPNAKHHGGVYRAASWVYCGQCEETRSYVNDETGESAPRRAFHSGGLSQGSLEQIAATGFRQIRTQGKHRFARGLTRQARREITRRFQGATQ